MGSRGVCTQAIQAAYFPQDERDPLHSGDPTVWLLDETEEGAVSKPQLERLAAQVERTLKVTEAQAEPAAAKDLNRLYRLLDRLEGDREAERTHELTTG